MKGKIMNKPSKNRFEKGLKKRGSPRFRPDDPSAPGRLPKSTRHIQTSYRKTTKGRQPEGRLPEGRLSSCVPHNWPGKFEKNVSRGRKFRETLPPQAEKEGKFQKKVISKSKFQEKLTFGGIQRGQFKKR